MSTIRFINEVHGIRVVERDRCDHSWLPPDAMLSTPFGSPMPTQQQFYQHAQVEQQATCNGRFIVERRTGTDAMGVARWVEDEDTAASRTLLALIINGRLKENK